MRILSVTQSYAPFYEFGGPPVKVEALAKGLAQRGHAVTVLTTDWGFEERRQADPAAASSRRSLFGWAREVDGVESIYLPTWARFRALTWNPAVQRYCRARLAQYAIVHIFGLYDLLGFAVAKECRKRGIPYVVEPIGMFVPIVRNIALKALYHGLWGGRMLQGAAAVIATSEQEVEELARGWGSSGKSAVPRAKIVLRRNGVMVPRELPERGVFRAKLALPANAQIILFLGRLSEKKSPALLLEAFAQLPLQIGGRELRLVIVGPDESGMQARLEKLAAERGVRERVTFAGAVFGKEKWSVYRDADVFVLPSQNENFGNTAVEAAAAGTPVVITENCGVASLLGGDGGIVVRRETSEVARAVKEVLLDGELRKRLAQGGKSAASRLGWEEPVSQMELLYGRIAVSTSKS